MWHDQRDTPPHFAVDHARARKHGEQKPRNFGSIARAQRSPRRHSPGVAATPDRSVRRDFIIVDEIRNADDLPQGWQGRERIESGMKSPNKA